MIIRSNSIIREHEDLQELPIISGKDVGAGNRILNPERGPRRWEHLEHLLTGRTLKEEYFSGRTWIISPASVRPSCKGAEETTFRVTMECLDQGNCARELVQENFIKCFLQYRPLQNLRPQEWQLYILFNYFEPDGLEFYHIRLTKAFGGLSLKY